MRCCVLLVLSQGVEFLEKGKKGSRKAKSERTPDGGFWSQITCPVGLDSLHVETKKR